MRLTFLKRTWLTMHNPPWVDCSSIREGKVAKFARTQSRAFGVAGVAPPGGVGGLVV